MTRKCLYHTECRRCRYYSPTTPQPSGLSEFSPGTVWGICGAPNRRGVSTVRQLVGIAERACVPALAFLERTNDVERPSFVTDDHLEYLDTLRDSGEINMLGAIPYLQSRFYWMSHREALRILGYWMLTFGTQRDTGGN